VATKKQTKPDNPQAFKHLVNEASATRLARELAAVHAAFDARGYVREVVRTLPELELKPRIRLLSDTLVRYLPSHYPDALAILLGTLGPPLGEGEGAGASAFYYWVHASFVEHHGLAHPELSLAAMREITQRSTAEFAVRPYLHQHLERTLAFLRTCARDPNPHVRRWVSEGTRPYLPWGTRVPALVREPAHGLALLELLRGDASAYVRTSLANHLNDVSKLDAAVAIGAVRRWLADGVPGAEWVAQRALRGLVKAGHADALAVFGVDKRTSARVTRFQLAAKSICVGEQLTFEATIAGEKSERLVVDYAVLFPGARERMSRKVFKWATPTLAQGERLTLTKRHSFKPITTRVYRAGSHTLELLVNGNVVETAHFTLVL
jgi:3-methyladenine DNA glycosylase AlkC